MSTIKRPVLERFVDDYPDKAVDVLLKACHDPDIRQVIVDFLLDPGQPPKNKMQNTSDPTNSNIGHPISTPRSPPVSQRTSSFSGGHRRKLSRNIPGVNAEPPSPPKSRSDHSKTPSSKDDTQKILILTTNDDDDDIKKDIAIMKSAPIQYSVIAEHMFSAGRIPESEIEDLDEQLIVSLPRREMPATLIDLEVTSYAVLTWKSIGSTRSKASHSTSFYLVREEYLDVDVLLGGLDSGEDMPEIMPSHQQRFGQGFGLREHAANAHAGNSQSDSYHRSELYEYPNQPGRTQPSALMQEFVRGQSERATASKNTPLTTPNQGPESSRTQRPATADPLASINTSDQAPASEQIRVSCTLGSNSFAFYLNLYAVAEAIFETFQAQLQKKHGPFNRATVLVVFGRDKHMSDGTCELSLGENELEGDWDNAVAWIRENKKPTVPHIYATIQLDGG